MIRSFIRCLAAVTLLFSEPAVAQGDSNNFSLVSRNKLIDDARRLADLLEEVHPDPYLGGGGKISFHRRLQDVLRAIPEDGMSPEAFSSLLQPFVNSIGDGHTSLRSFFQFDPDAAGRLPLWFSALPEVGLYVKLVKGAENERLIGARLVAVEGLAFSELMRRVRSMWPAENDFHALWNMNGALIEPSFRAVLMPELEVSSSLRMEFEFPDGNKEETTVDCSLDPGLPWIRHHKTEVELPGTERCDIAYSFLSSDKKVALLRIDSQEQLKEIVEGGLSLGVDSMVMRDMANSIYERFNAVKAPTTLDSILAGLPSATDVFRNLAVEMKQADTDALIIDLSRNAGGQSIVSDILIYFLYGKQQLMDLRRTTRMVDKYSDHFFQIMTHMSLDSINGSAPACRPYLLRGNDYDFHCEADGSQSLGSETGYGDMAAQLDIELQAYTSFYEEYRGGRHDGYFTPRHVIALCSNQTFSAGFGTLADLYKSGATVTGTPSGQAGNCFGNAVEFRLRNTLLGGFVSTKHIEMFPGDPEKGRVLMPHYPLSYAKLVEYEFDSNALVLHALDIIANATE
ncbi:MAG: S41 family peptidase [bacterium]